MGAGSGTGSATGAGACVGAGSGSGTDTSSGFGAAATGTGLGELSHSGSKTRGNIEGFLAGSGRAAGDGGRGTEAGSAHSGSVWRSGNRMAVSNAIRLGPNQALNMETET